ncbi:gp30 DNA ligase [Escherichia phage vB_EcoM_VR7]|uniref:Gp30 DNA ligase n=1 Tax=Escherichia phage vB_EcoM_VR7 TaxID=700939 RepID=E5FIP8_9CAUD|nr:gp30 DNA ligase [Escherichia phage vB_EcoM_VR7]ADR32589.1 gp30 DNA ligase [Escherichia phage vB_EcoM_VR7]
MILDILNEIAATDSTKEKQAILESYSENETLKRVYRLTYSKGIQFYIKKWPKPGTTTQSFGMLNISDMLDFIEFTLAPRKLTGNAAIEELSGYIADGKKDDVEVLRRVMMRDLECGASVSIANKVWKGLIPEQPQMLASSYDEAGIAKNIKFPAFAQLKADGARCFAEVRGDELDDVRLLSRAGNEYLKLDLLKKELIEATREARERHPEGVLIDGELVYHEQKTVVQDDGLAFLFDDTEQAETQIESAESRTKSNGLANKSLKGTITAVEAAGMKFQVWDYVPLIEVYSDVKILNPLKYDVRFAVLEKMIADNVVLHGYDRMILIENHVVNNLEEAKAIYKKYIALKLEGIILKNTAAPWENKRSKNMYKFKEVIDIALEIIGFYEHEKDPNKIGGVVLQSSCGKIVTNCGSGFKDTTQVKDPKTKKWAIIPIDERHEMDREALMIKARKGELVGMIADCECNGWLTSETRKDNTVKLFLPIIKGFRFDKDKADTFEEVFGDWSQTGLK